MPVHLRRMFPAPVAIIALAAFAALFGGPASSAAAGGGGCHGALTGDNRDASGNVVVMRQACFLPTVLRTGPGTKVTFVNEDEMAHVVAGVGMEWGSAKNLSASSAFEATFDKPGIYPYACPLHYGMVGAVVVGDGKFASTSPGVTGDIVRSGAAPVAAAAQPTAVARSLAAPATTAGDDRRSPWLYAGGGLIAGALLATLLGAAVLAKRG